MSHIVSCIVLEEMGGGGGDVAMDVWVWNSDCGGLSLSFHVLYVNDSMMDLMWTLGLSQS